MIASRSDTHERSIIFKPDSPLELILPGVNINGPGDSLTIPCRCCWTMGTECYHTFPVFRLASNANNLCLPPFPKFTYLERHCCFCISQIKYHYSLYLKEQSKLCILMAISISDIMSKKLETIEEMASVQEAAKKMKDKNVSSLVVVDANGKLEGLVTERDLVRKVCINDIRTSTVTNKEIMSSPLITIDSNSSPSIAAHMMLQTNVKHLLVVDKSNVNKPVGIITPVDLRYAVLYTDEELKARY